MQNIDTGVQNKHPNTELYGILHSYDHYFTMVPGTKKQKQLSDWGKKKKNKKTTTNKQPFLFIQFCKTCYNMSQSNRSNLHYHSQSRLIQKSI